MTGAGATRPSIPDLPEGFEDAILVDNGGDVGLYLPEEDRFGVPPSEPDRRSRWPLTACLIFYEEREA